MKIIQKRHKKQTTFLVGYQKGKLLFFRNILGKKCKTVPIIAEIWPVREIFPKGKFRKIKHFYNIGERSSVSTQIQTLSTQRWNIQKFYEYCKCFLITENSL